ncbi:hypothetical protein NL676_000332 [Syzygium grande]|nr:hypothetical protein NL676_000332 [Syzygium grande]
MEIDEVEAVLEKIWDLHDKLSDAIHSISRAHFLSSIRALRKPEQPPPPPPPPQQPQQQSKKQLFGADAAAAEDNRAASGGYVFVKEFGVYDEAVQEAKSLNAIRTALENLEDQLEFFHTVQLQQRAERDAAIARLEQSRIVLAMRLAEHQGKKYKVIEEALAFVGDVCDASRFVSCDNLFGAANGSSGQSMVNHGKRSNILIKALISSFNFAKKSLMGGVLGNAALVAVTMMTLLHFNKVAYKELKHKHEGDNYSFNVRKTFKQGESSSRGSLGQLDVLVARG